MSVRQRNILVAGAIVLLLSCLFVPWYAEDDSGYLDYGYAFFFSAEAVYLDLHRICVEWMAILAATAAAYFGSGEGRHAPYRRRYGTGEPAP